MNEKDYNSLLDELLIRIDEKYDEVLHDRNYDKTTDTHDYLPKKYKNGINNNFSEFIKEYEKEKTVADLDFTFRAKLISRYLQKSKNDLSAKDIVKRIFQPFGTPPIEMISISSFEKKILKVFDEPQFINKIYVKQTTNGINVKCLNYLEYESITQYPTINNHIIMLIEKVKQTTDNSVEKTQYILENNYLNYIDSQSYDDQYDQSYYLSYNDEMAIMIKAIFSIHFTEFDKDAYVNDKNSLDYLSDNQDFGEEYQKLSKIMNATNFNYKYFQKK